ncbi:MAG: hypothetical protein HY047_01245 [Acidobacteria bacterium]|nr:hypothetical protein [Acidobacteriota bacterium]
MPRNTTAPAPRLFDRGTNTSGQRIDIAGALLADPVERRLPLVQVALEIVHRDLGGALEAFANLLLCEASLLDERAHTEHREEHTRQQNRQAEQGEHIGSGTQAEECPCPSEHGGQPEPL